MVTHKVPTEDLHSSSGFGALHLAVLSVAARFLDPDAWMENLLRQEDAANCRRQSKLLDRLLTFTRRVTYSCAESRDPRLSLRHNNRSESRFGIPRFRARRAEE